jgi:hypothetical protein
MEKSNGCRDTEFVLRIRVSDYPMSSDQLTELLGLAPTRSHNKGDFLRPGHFRKRSTWTKDSVSRGSLVMSAHILRFLDAMGPLPERLKQLVGQCKISVTCHINDYGRGYVIYCESTLVQRLAELNASLEVVVHKGDDDAEAPLTGSIGLGFVPEPD